MFISLGTGCNFDREQNWSSTPVTLCTDNASCGDGDSCTINTCGIDGKCTSAPSPSCSSKSIVCGSTKSSACNADPGFKKASPNEEHYVRCCADTSQGSGWKQNGSCASGTYGESICVGKKTFEVAQQTCINAGGRLCTQAELLADCTKGKLSFWCILTC